MSNQGGHDSDNGIRKIKDKKNDFVIIRHLGFDSPTAHRSSDGSCNQAVPA